MNDFAQFKPQFKTKEDYAYEILRELILECEIKPGEKLVIDQISQQMEISTIPIRATIQRLGMEGLVEIKPHAPARVTEITLDMVKETFSLLAALEQVAFEAVTKQANPKQIDQLETLVQEMEEAAKQEDLKLWAQKNIAFHRHIAESTNMPLLIEFTHRAFDQWRRLSNFYFKSVPATRIQQAQKEHWQILDCIKTKKIKELISLAKHHNQAAFESYCVLIQEA